MVVCTSDTSGTMSSAKLTPRPIFKGDVIHAQYAYSLIPRLLLPMQKSRGRRSLDTRLGYACTICTSSLVPMQALPGDEANVPGIYLT